MIESIRFHKVGDKIVHEMYGFPKDVNIYIELIVFFGGGGAPIILKNRPRCYMFSFRFATVGMPGTVQNMGMERPEGLCRLNNILS